MSLSRRDFIKLFGVAVASLSVTRCRPFVPTATCYIPVVTPEPSTARDRLRKCWLSFGELQQATRDEAQNGSDKNALGAQLSSEHRAALDELVSYGELTPSVADLIQEAYDAALYHVWRSNAPTTCYEPAMIDYAPTSASVLVQQSAELDALAQNGEINSQTLAKAQAALEHDLAYYALTEQEVNALYESLSQDWQNAPGFEELDLEITEDAQAAAKFIVDLLTQDQ
jgi:hypothetical protein